MQAQDYERSSRASSSELSLWTVHDLLRVFYGVIWDLARLLQTSALLSDLEDHVDPTLKADDPRKTEKRLQWVCTEPVLVMKVWSRLYNLQLNVPFEDRKQKAPQSILDDCMYIKDHIRTLVLLIRNDIAQKYIEYLLWLDQTSEYLTTTYPIAMWWIKRKAKQQMYREAVGDYLHEEILKNWAR